MTPSFYNDTLKAQSYTFWKFLKSTQKICQIVKLCNHEFFVGPRLHKIFFFLVSKKGIPESFFTLSTHFTQVAAVAFGSVVVARAMCEICHFNEPTLRTECSCMQPFSPPLSTRHATKVLSSGSCTTNQHQHHPPHLPLDGTSCCRCSGVD